MDSRDPGGVFPELCRSANPVVGWVEKIEVNPAAVLEVFGVFHRNGKPVEQTKPGGEVWLAQTEGDDPAPGHIVG